MRAAAASFLLLQVASRLSGCRSSSPFRRRPSPLRRASHTPPSRLRAPRGVLALPRGGSDDDGSTGSYHGRYVSAADGTPPTGGAAALPAVVRTTAPPPAAPLVGDAAAAPPPPVLASATSTGSKLANLRERTGPAVVLLAGLGLLLRCAGAPGFIGLVLLIQAAMYHEATSVAGAVRQEEGGEVGPPWSSVVEKWWWFATAVMLTSGRKMLAEHTAATLDQMNLLTFGMSSASLVGAVVRLATVSGATADEVYRRYLGRAACCHFSLLFLVGQSSFWIDTVREYGLVWILFPALLVVINDTMAYVCGVLLGKHKLLPRLSPKKTVEGFVGAGLLTTAAAVPLLRRMLGEGAPGAAAAGRHALALAAYASLVAPFGGFLASAVKRAHGAKDFGDLIPGHGGVVDRCDCQVVTAPFVYLYLRHCLPAATSSPA